MTIRNPKQEGTPFFDCIPQVGPCRIDCNQCFYNRPGAYYVPIDKPHVPTPAEVGDGIVRMNCGNDSNNDRELVLQAARQYKRTFFNTSLPAFEFPGPVVFTANRREEEYPTLVDPIPDNLMFVRLRTSATNLKYVDTAADYYAKRQVPVVITFMAYYDCQPVVDEREVGLPADQCYVWKIRHVNPYWCATPALMQAVMDRYVDLRLVSMCDSIASGYCRDCRNCESHYLQTMKRLRGE